MTGPPRPEFGDQVCMYSSWENTQEFESTTWQTSQVALILWFKKMLKGEDFSSVEQISSTLNPSKVLT